MANTGIIKIITIIKVFSALLNITTTDTIKIIERIVIIVKGAVTINPALEGVIKFYYLIVVIIYRGLVYIKSRYKNYKTYRCHYYHRIFMLFLKPNASLVHGSILF